MIMWKRHSCYFSVKVFFLRICKSQKMRTLQSVKLTKNQNRKKGEREKDETDGAPCFKK